MKITFRQLLVFETVAATGSTSAAATRLGMSQSAASGALTDLQVILHRQLFAYTRGKALQITDEGRRLLPLARSLLVQAQEFELGGDEAPLAGTLVIGATEVIAETVLPRLCAEFVKSHPAVKVRVNALSVDDLVGRLMRFELETALIESFPDAEGIELIRWRDDELLLVVAPDHPLYGLERLTIEDLRGMRWCMREPESSVSGRLRLLLHEHVGQLDVVFESTSNWAVRHAVRAGMGIGCLSRALVQLDLKHGRLGALDVQDFNFTRVLSLARPRGIMRSRLATTFDAFLLARGNADLS